MKLQFFLGLVVTQRPTLQLKFLISNKLPDASRTFIPWRSNEEGVDHVPLLQTRPKLSRITTPSKSSDTRKALPADCNKNLIVAKSASKTAHDLASPQSRPRDPRSHYISSRTFDTQGYILRPINHLVTAPKQGCLCLRSHLRCEHCYRLSTSRGSVYHLPFRRLPSSTDLSFLIWCT